MIGLAQPQSIYRNCSRPDMRRIAGLGGKRTQESPPTGEPVGEEVLGRGVFRQGCPSDIEDLHERKGAENQANP